MSDPFDAFHAFDPLPEDEHTHASKVPSAPDAMRRPESAPAAEPTAAEPVGTRRWSAPRRSRNTTDRSSVAPTSAQEESGTPPEIAAEPPAMPALGREPGPAPFAVIRAIAVPELRAAALRLRSHGHDAEVRDELEDGGEPCLAMRFRPDPGPFGPPVPASGSHARFELRLAVELDSSALAAAPDAAGDLQLFAGYAAAAGGRFVLLGRTPLDSMTAEWVSQRIVDFVARALDRD